MVNGPGRAYVERGGRLEAVALELDASAIVRLVERVVAPLGLRLDRSSPMVDARLPDGSRLHAVIPPLAIDGPCVTIRRFGARPVPLGGVRPRGAAAAFLRWAVARGLEHLVAGRHQRGQDHAAERAVEVRSPPTSGSSRSRRRPSCGSRNRTSCGSRRDRRMPRARAAVACARAGAGGAAHAPRSHRRRRGAWRRGARHAAGTQHRSRRLDVHHPRERRGRRAGAARDARAPRRRRAAARGGARAGRRERSTRSCSSPRRAGGVAASRRSPRSSPATNAYDRCSAGSRAASCRVNSPEKRSPAP